MSIYVIDKHKTLGKDFDLNSDEDFVKESKAQGLNFTPKEFHKFFNANLDEVSSKQYMIKVFDRISYSLSVVRVVNSIPPTTMFNFSDSVDIDDEKFHRRYSLIYTELYNDGLMNTEGKGRLLGYLSITKQEAWKFFGSKYITKAKIKILKDMLSKHISDYNQYLMGHVYDYVLKNFDDVTVGSGQGFYGKNHMENGLVKSLPENVQANIDECSNLVERDVWIQ